MVSASWCFRTSSIENGSFHGLIGPNGSGKSTLLKAIAGAHLSDAGTVTFGWRDITVIIRPSAHASASA